LAVRDPVKVASGKITALKTGREMKPEQIIPLKEEDFKDF